jgi:RNA polymerase-interacting CarD/CdnL/TRCF family regulator
MAFFHRYLPVAADARLAPPDLHRPIPLYDPEGILDRVNRTFRRRMSDRVEDLFQEACMSGDLTTAEELLTVLERMQSRQRGTSRSNRRVSDGAFAKAHEELARRKRLAAP